MFIVLIVFVIFTVFVLVVFIALGVFTVLFVFVLLSFTLTLSPHLVLLSFSLSGIDFFVHCRATSIKRWRGDESASNAPAYGAPPPDAPAQEDVPVLGAFVPCADVQATRSSRSKHLNEINLPISSQRLSGKAAFSSREVATEGW